ncbi:protein CNGC15c-like [Bidens hawaiensis]|uniref:protein CNGC15c-like n=1 Tax=Bidens hawaiensis TaxID=980011 RepID=UPI0040498174
MRSIADVFYMIQIYVKFMTAYVAPSSRVFGRGELVIDSAKIAKRYIKGDLWIDFVAALPLPQLLIWIIIPSLSGSAMTNTKNVLRFIIILQYIPRLYLIFPLTTQIVEATGVVTETAWAGAAYYLMLYMLASHFVGASWYLLSIERQESCWRSICVLENLVCKDDFFDCQRVNESARRAWFQTSNVTNECAPNSGFYPFGIYGESLESEVTSALFFNKCFYFLWFGLKNLSIKLFESCSSLGQNLSTSTYLLPELRQSVRRHDQYKWVATRGVDEESLLRGLPLDLRRDIKRHLCYDLVRRVPLFDQMDQRMLDAICERLKPALCTQGTCLVREGDPVNEMLFIVRGNLDSYTTNGGRTGFFNSCRIGPGDFCGEELLTWALDPSPSVILPSSTRTVKAISEVEAFALIADDLKFVASQFRRLHSKQLRHKFRFYSHQWRTWAACFVQAVWRRYKRRKSARELQAHESFKSVDYEMGFSSPLHGGNNVASPDPGYGVYVGASRRPSGSKTNGSGSLQKPEEPDFSVDE